MEIICLCCNSALKKNPFSFAWPPRFVVAMTGQGPIGKLSGDRETVNWWGFWSPFVGQKRRLGIFEESKSLKDFWSWSKRPIFFVMKNLTPSKWWFFAPSVRAILEIDFQYLFKLWQYTCPLLEDDCIGQVSGSMPLMNVVFLLTVLQIIGMIGMPPTAPTPRRVQLRVNYRWRTQV